jgi:ribosomal protein L11 methyltransferase
VFVAGVLELSFDLGSLDPLAAEAACLACGASAVTFIDAADDPVLEPLPGEVRLWRRTRLKSLFADATNAALITRTLSASLAIDAHRISAQRIADCAWEREWLKDFHAMRFGARLWICPHHEQVVVVDPHAVVVALEPGLAFGSGTHASTALCLTWLDEHLPAGAQVIDFGCGCGVLAVAAAKLGARAVHCFDIDPQALTATRENAAANSVGERVHAHAKATRLPGGADVLLANILAARLCALAPFFARLVRAPGWVVLAGILEHEVADVTAAYAACFDVARFGGRDGWAGLAGRRR